MGGAVSYQRGTPVIKLDNSRGCGSQTGGRTDSGGDAKAVRVCAGGLVALPGELP